MTKTCKKCLLTQPVSEYYKHSLNADGLFSQCKSCERQRQRERLSVLSKDPEWIANERERQRVKTIQYRLAGKRDGYNPVAAAKWGKKNRLKKRAHLQVFKAVKAGVILKSDRCNRCGIKTSRLDGHHEDYSKPLSVEWLCNPCHKKHHRKPLPE